MSVRRLLKKTCLVILFYGLLTGCIFCHHALAGKIVIFGDSQVDTVAQRQIVKSILPFKPSIIFRVGDMVNDGDDPKQWELFRDINGPLLKNSEYFPVLGNHEKDAALYFKNFLFLKNKRWYSIERQGLHFIVLDSNSSLKVKSEQYRWLESDLKDVKGSIQFKIVFFHHPIFDVGEGHSEDEKKLGPILLDLFQKYGVSLVFSGHEHNYQRFDYQGVCFIVTGGGGSFLVGQARSSPYLQKFQKAYHFCLLSLEDDSLRVIVRDVYANTIDDFKIQGLVLTGESSRKNNWKQ